MCRPCAVPILFLNVTPLNVPTVHTTRQVTLAACSPLTLVTLTTSIIEGMRQTKSAMLVRSGALLLAV
jgi:hypothetical protein